MDSAFSILTLTTSSPGEPLLGGLDAFWILLLIVLGSAINEWLKKKKQTGKKDSWPTGSGSDSQQPHDPATQQMPRPASPRPKATSDWEEQLRRLLDGEMPVAKQPPVAPPPIRPVIVQEPKPAPPQRRVVAAARAASTAPLALSVPGTAEASKTVEVHPQALKESAAAYQRASHLHEGVAEHLKRVEEMTEHHPGKAPTAHRPGFSTEAAQTITLIRNPRTARKAIIASLIFGPPKALEGE
ncbi:MAG: hypothetical protein DME21_05185 [Verrucomicrobia bacterium]|nr:MAG: hypothetical protein DME21_05185 [Verrucomicrobiota bacterium]